MKTRFFIGVIFFLSIFALGISGYLIRQHYAPSTGFCLPGIKSNSCDIVNKSLYSEIFGVPLGLYGVLFFLMIASLSGIFFFEKKINPLGLDHKKLSEYLFFLLLGGFAFIFYLVYIELFVLYAICIFCTAVHILITIMFFCVWWVRRKVMRR